MRIRSSVASCLALLLLLAVSAPVGAAPRDEPRWQRPIDGITRVVKGVARYLGISSNGDGMIPPIPKP
jgi:hypothetical protein